jgi:hypothetical protein
MGAFILTLPPTEFCSLQQPVEWPWHTHVTSQVSRSLHNSYQGKIAW